MVSLFYTFYTSSFCIFKFLCFILNAIYIFVSVKALFDCLLMKCLVYAGNWVTKIDLLLKLNIPMLGIMCCVYEFVMRHYIDSSQKAFGAHCI